MLDFLRGLAILGMLIPNGPWHVGDSMFRVHDADALSVLAWLVQYLAFDQRFVPIFCMLFGAGFALLYERKGAQGFGAYMLVRNAVLLLLGIAHAYLLWPGDILITYAVCSPALLLALGFGRSRLLGAALLLKCVGLAFAEWPFLYEVTLGRWLFTWWWEVGPAPSSIAEAYAGSYLDLFRYNAWRNQFLQWMALPDFRIWNALAFMLVGVVLYREGILQGRRTDGFYRRMTIVALVAGGPFVLYGVLARVGANPTVGPWLGFTSELPLSRLTFSIGCAVTSFAVVGLAHLVHRRGLGRGGGWIESIGRMALSNYLLQSAVFLVLFHALEVLPFDALDHDAFFLLALAMGIIHVVVSEAVLRRRPHGPAEALWRSTTDRAVGWLGPR